MDNNYNQNNINMNSNNDFGTQPQAGFNNTGYVPEQNVVTNQIQQPTIEQASFSMQQPMPNQPQTVNSNPTLMGGQGDHPTNSFYSSTQTNTINEPNKKNNKNLIIIIACVVFAVIVGLVLFFVFKDKKTSDDSSLDNYLKDKEEQKIINDEELAEINKNYTITETILPNGKMLLEFENKNSVAVNASIKVEFYDENENVVEVKDGYLFYVEAKKKSYELIYVDLNNLKYSKYKITAKLTKDEFTEFYNDNITIESNKTIDNIIFQVTNSASVKLDSEYFGILYYDENNQIVGYDEKSFSSLNVSEKTSGKFDLPYDANYHNISFNRYEIVVLYAIVEKF